VILGPFLDVIRALFGDISRNEWPDARRAGPGTGVDPKSTMCGNAVKLHFGFGKRVLDFLRALEARFALEHVIGGLCSGRAGPFGVLEELREAFGAMLRPFNAGMKTV